MRYSRLAVAFVLLASGAHAPGQSDDSSGTLRLEFDRSLTRLRRSLPPDPDSWTYYITVPDNDREDIRNAKEVARYIVPHENDDAGACRLRSRKNYVGVFRLVRPGFENARRMSWKWSVSAHPHGGKIGGIPNDQSMQVYVLFRETLANGQFNYTALAFVWTHKTTDLQQAMQGRMPWDGSPRAEMVLFALRNGPIPGEIPEEVDLRAEYRKAFSREAPPIWGIALLADSNEVEPDVGRMTTDAAIRDIRLTK
jgi:Protein of unknown function (DUF3047)